MDNIDLYKKIESLLWKLEPLVFYSGDMRDRQEAQVQRDILHFIQLGEDGVAILETKLNASNGK